MKYEDALKRAKSFYDDPDCRHTIKWALEKVFPELAKPEDERIRKQLLEMVHDFTGDSLWVDYNIHKEDAIAWLEKQDEQKNQQPADITNKLKEEYQRGWDAAMQQLPKEVDSQIWQIANNSAKTWEESFAILCASQKAYDKGKKDALKEQKPADWSEEDESILDHIIVFLRTQRDVLLDNDANWLKNKLKSLRLQSHWKPSEEQMKCLDNVKGADDHNGYVLNTLYNDLKKL